MIRTWSRTRSAVMLRDKPRREFNGRTTCTRHMGTTYGRKSTLDRSTIFKRWIREIQFNSFGNLGCSTSIPKFVKEGN